VNAVLVPAISFLPTSRQPKRRLNVAALTAVLFRFVVRPAQRDPDVAARRAALIVALGLAAYLAELV
jgi:hypothetical protein